MLIELFSAPSEELFIALQKLIPQLASNHTAPTQNEVDLLVTSPGSIVFAARHPGKTSPIVGIATLAIYRVPTGIRAHLEDVVVDKAARGLGIGKALTQAAIEHARLAGADGVALTSHPRRLAANALYIKLGFRRWDTNLYFFKF